MMAVRELGRGVWGLGRARETARAIEGSAGAVRALVRNLFGEDTELRMRAADVARRVTEVDPAPLHGYAEELAGLLAELPAGEARTRWHLGLVVPRVAHTWEQRLRAARLMTMLAEDASNVVRCSAVEGLGLLAMADSSLLREAEELIERFLRHGTPANKSRARQVKVKLSKRYGAPA